MTDDEHAGTIPAAARPPPTSNGVYEKEGGTTSSTAGGPGRSPAEDPPDKPQGWVGGGHLGRTRDRDKGIDDPSPTRARRSIPNGIPRTSSRTRR